ncbi:gamma-glutamyltransferase [Marinifilum breve]|uniref:Glutathione hydrolase proenzyme n=1 Tax=Marinifilum breve TaxID=2184082 RepID=A0A2V3ZSD4_9BACT|nr:gamma-glutamyltransferase [Marinifilum breve]PXX96206.1 gamma-glutamyltransferase [Marinifilum breve]
MQKFIPLFLLLILSINSFAQDRITGFNFATRSEVIAKNGMACTSQPLATHVALDILKSGGNAVDAAIAANATLGLMEPTGCGIGGDIFVILWDAKTKKLYGLNGSGRSPKSLTLDYLKQNTNGKIPAYGPLPVSVPGCVDGWFTIHKKFGKLDMEKILQPAITYAKEGFPVSELIAYYMNGSAKRLKKYPGFAETYMPNGKMPQKGEIFKNPFLANTYEKIAKDGRDAFYKGDIAKSIAKYIKEQGGFLSYEDLASHKSEWVDPISVNYRGCTVWELPPNGQGTAALQILNILKYYDIAKMGFGSTDYLHTFIEAKKLAFEDRAKFYTDPDFSEIPIKELISNEYALERKELIDPNKAAREYPAGELEQGNTIYLTVADKEGNMVSLIQSNYRGMGSGMTPKGLGFVLQDRGELFSLNEDHANVYAPGKRPFHTIIPAFITKDEKPFISFGLMGGAMQPQGHAQIVVNLIDFGMNLQEAGDAPRIRHEGSSQPTGTKMKDGGWVNLESGIAYQSIRELMQKGHKIKYSTGGFGGYQAIMFDEKNSVYYGASESRKDGQAAGY